jgi:hypothetical protein
MTDCAVSMRDAVTARLYFFRFTVSAAGRLVSAGKSGIPRLVAGHEPVSIPAV